MMPIQLPPQLSCPSCRSGQQVVYRRRPPENGRVVTECSCRRCGMEFEFEDSDPGSN